MTEKCKGFWNMCTCPRCLAEDAKLEKELEADREMTTKRAIKELKKARKDLPE